jgi:sodium-dependent dicarboxylate transporter 2/3/5
LLILVICLVVTFTTELASNTATSAIFMPILAGTAATLEVDPRMLMIPATISASCAFMLPIATPPNAIVFGSGYLTTPQMCRAGVWMNLVGAVLATLVTLVLVR